MAREGDRLVAAAAAGEALKMSFSIKDHPFYERMRQLIVA
jgi:hypothetical protein